MQSWQVLSTPALTVIHSLEHNSPVIVVTLGVWWQFAKWKPSVFTWLPSAVWKHFNQREYCAVAYSKCLKIYLVVKVHCSNLSPQSGTPWVIIEFRWLFEQENHPNEIFSKLLELNSFLFLFFWLFFFLLSLGSVSKIETNSGIYTCVFESEIPAEKSISVKGENVLTLLDK